MSNPGKKPVKPVKKQKRPQKPAAGRAPAHLEPATKTWWLSVVATFYLEPHHVRLLTLPGQAWDRGEQARLALKLNGLTYLDRAGLPRARPEVAIERDSRLAFARLIRELGLDVDAPEAPRAATIAGGRHAG